MKSTIQYGPETTALVSVLNTLGAVSIDRIHDILHGACNRNYAYISVEKKRGYDGMVASGILPCFRGIAVPDFWRPYERFDV
ncbi:MAG: hypothetical protein U9Q00_05515, partial [Synergistota bacterium]|nr:hypothetical protein [Synergistota bacterium]